MPRLGPSCCVFSAALLLSATTSASAQSAAPPAPTPVAAAAGDRRAWLGVFLGDALDGGVRLVAVVPGGPAAQAGLQPGDIILQLGERSVSRRPEADLALSTLRPGQKIKVKLIRGGHVEDRIVTTASRAPTWTLTIPPPLPEGGDAGAATARVFGVQWIAIPDELRIAWGAPGEAGVLVGGVNAGSSAATAGLRVGDVVTGVNGTPVSDPHELPFLLTKASSTLAVVRRGAERTLQVVISKPAQPLVLDGTAPEHPSGSAAEVRRLEAEVNRLQEEIRRLREELDRVRDKQ